MYQQCNVEIEEEEPDERLDRGFGWLQADMRVPLPSLAGLREACHLVGNHNGRHMFLCASAEQDGLDGCVISADFSTHYGDTVYVCAGGSAERYRS